jgi:triacylglycerol lipase
MNSPFANRFDFGNAAHLAGASARAYGAAARSDGIGESQWFEASSTDTRALILRFSDDVVVAFRGTADPRNWLTDFDCKFVREKGCRIHTGFNAALDSIEDKIVPGIIKALQGGSHRRRLWLTGHSLGGALAMLFAWRVVARNHRQPFSGVYTFGQPRVGDSVFRDTYHFSGLSCRTFRVVHSADLIPHLPCLLGCYRHPWHEIFFRDMGEWREDGPFLWKAAGEAAANFHRMARLRVAELADHHIDTYLNLFRDLKHGGREPAGVLPVLSRAVQTYS